MQQKLQAWQAVSVGGSTVVGFSLTNTEIPAGSGVLTVMSFDSVTADTSELTLGMAGPVTSAAGFIYDTDASGSVAHTTDCAGDYYGSAVEDECGVCNGSGPAENFDCDGNCLVEVDCAGECNGSAVEDECGVCNGGGIADGACDCDGNVLDCAGECNGSAVEDSCGVCGGADPDAVMIVMATVSILIHVEKLCYHLQMQQIAVLM